MKPLVKTCAGLCAAGFLALVGLASLPAADAPDETSFVVVDANGKEHALKACKFTAGTRTLGWLASPPQDNAPPPPKPKPGDPVKGPAGPQALEVRDDASLNPPLVAGFVTLVPLDQIRSIVFDDNEVMTVRTAAEKDDIVTGSAKYKGINKVTIEAEVDKGDLGIAEVKFLGGVPKGMKSIRFPKPKASAEPATGKTATVTTSDMKKTTHKVTDLQPLYKTADGEKLVPTLFFKKTLKIDLAKIVKVKVSPDARDGDEWMVTLKEGDEETLSLLKQVTIDGKPAQLEGLVGKVAVGYKLFPPATIAEIVFE